MTELSKNEDWMNSKAACRDLHVSACDLSHIHENGYDTRKKGTPFVIRKMMFKD
jgi:hypothetical protein